MNTNIQKNIKSLKKNYIFHIILYAFIIIFNFILSVKVFWLKDYLYYTFFIGNFFNILYLIIPIIPLIFILLKKLRKKKIKFFRILTIVFCVIAIIFGLFFSVILMMNVIESPEFSRECPFNLDISYLSTEFSQYYDKIIDINDNSLKNKCLNRRCSLDSINKNNDFTYEFICNYNPTDEFEELSGRFEKEINENRISSDYEIICNKIDSDNFNFENEIIYKYYDICNDFSEFYVCERFDEPKKYSVKENFVCPNENYITKLVMFCVLDVLVNLIISFFPWKIEYSHYSNILNYYYQQRNPLSNSLNSTKNSSKNQKENIQEKVSERFPTETIIVYNERNNNLNLNNLNNEFEINTMNRNIININRINNNIQQNQIKINKVNTYINNKEKNNEEINSVQIIKNTEENNLNKPENIKDKNQGLNVPLPSERIMLTINKK